jgi:predicted choloylglycine hydrolase
MSQQRLEFRALRVGDGTDGRWAAEGEAALRQAESFLADEARTPEGAARARRLFEEHMPELVPVLDRLAAQLPDPALAATALTHVGMRPFYAACTATGVAGVLLRNYDFPPDECDRAIVSSTFLRPVIGMNDSGWGLLDGMNDAGLAACLTFGGRFVHGYGFTILMGLRYVLETCDTVEQAVAVFERLPISLAQNVVLVDREQSVTLYLGPDLDAPIRAGEPTLSCATNHQHLPVPERQERESRTQERLATVRKAAADDDPVATTRAALLRPPLHVDAFDDGYGTLYTAEYHPAAGRVSYHWPDGSSWSQSFAAFAPGERVVTAGRG